MKYRNYELLNDVLESIWDIESFLNYVQLSIDESNTINKENVEDMRHTLIKLQKLCIEMA